MKKIQLLFILLLILSKISFTQIINSPCSFEKMLERQLELNPNALSEQIENEHFTESFIKNQLKNSETVRKNDPYIIPVVLHVFHDGDNGRIDYAQAQSGIDIMNDDFNGMNDGWNTINPQFDAIKSSLNIRFCLATTDPDGNKTTGINYYEDPNLVYNNGNLYQYGWDNFKYLNIYLPKYVFDSTGNFTAHASLPSLTNSQNGRDAIVYSSIRWGYGNHSELAPGQDWASVGTHEAGHWLNLQHTFRGACSGPGDYVDDTPPTEGGAIYLTSCKNNDFSCGVPTNGSNFMDYNHDCKKMFTEGQVARMTAALYMESRMPLWSIENLVETGCAPPPTSVSGLNSKNTILVYPNPADEVVNFKLKKSPVRIRIFDAFAKLVSEKADTGNKLSVNTRFFAPGLYFYAIEFEDEISSGKFLLK